MRRLFLIALALLAIIVYMSYLDIGFSEQLSRETTAPLPSQLDGLQAGNAFSEIEGDTINSEMQGQWVGSGIKANNITTGEMSFDHARGGTLQLGGFDNISGVFSLLDADELERIFMDKDGMVINKGSMTIKDATNKTVVDSQGLSSTGNFKSYGIIDSGTYTTTSTTFTDVSGMALNIIVTRGTKVLVGTTLVGYNEDAGDNLNSVVAGLFIDGVQIGGNIILPGIPKTAGILFSSGSTSSIIELSTGAHFLNVKYKVTTGGTARLGDQKSIYYVVLGS